MHEIKSITNFRELGNITTRDGSRIKSGRLLRSGELYKISAEDKQILNSEYNLSLIVDLRSYGEAAKNPDDKIAGSTYIQRDVMRAFEENHIGLDGLMDRLQLDFVDKKMKFVYKNLILNETAQYEYACFIKDIASLDSGACLFHCFAGKDRTGIAAAMILEILGVHRDDIFSDYLLTNQLRTSANKLICDEAAKEGLGDTQLEALEQMLLVKEEYLQQIYDIVEDHYGSFENYILDGLCLSKQDQTRLKSQYLA